MTGARDQPIVSRGGQAERTRLSWNRTALALAVNAALLTQTGGGSFAQHLPALAMLVAALGCFLFADRRYRAINTAIRNHQHLAAIAHTRTLAILTVLPALIALTAMLT